MLTTRRCALALTFAVALWSLALAAPSAVRADDSPTLPTPKPGAVRVTIAPVPSSGWFLLRLVRALAIVWVR